MLKIFGFLKPYKWKIVLITLLVGVAAAGMLLLPNFMSKIIGEGITAEYSYLNPATLENEIVTEDFCLTLPVGTECVVTQKSNLVIITKYGLIMIAITLVSSAANILISFLSSQVSTRFGRDVRRKIYQTVSSYSMAESDKFGTSTLITRSTNDIMQLQMFVMMGFRMFFIIPLLFFGGIIMSLQKSVTLTAVLLGGIPALVLFIGLVFYKALPLFKVMQKKINTLTLIGRESLNGVRVIRAFGQGDREVQRFQNANDDLTQNALKSGNIMASLNPFVNLLFSTVVLGVVIIAYRMVIGGTANGYEDIGNISAVIQYVNQIMFALIMFTLAFINYPRAEVAAKRVMEVLSTTATVIDALDTQYDNYPFQGNIKFDDVSFKYGDAEKDVLEHVSFEAKVGETIAIIGPTGSGKSTVINLLPRFFDVSGGKIRIDGIDIRDIKFAKLRSLFGFVPQTATLFTGTIRDNIAYGKPDATDDEIAWAAKISQATEFIDALDEHYESPVDQGGVNFSGGQKQRMSIARAIVRKPQIYVFDDSFSALDFKTDALLRKALRAETKNATTIIVAQRIGTIMDADRIIVLQDGKVVGMGTHKELLKTSPVYHEIALSQLSEEELQ